MGPGGKFQNSPWSLLGAPSAPSSVPALEALPNLMQRFQTPWKHHSAASRSCGRASVHGTKSYTPKLSNMADLLGDVDTAAVEARFAAVVQKLPPAKQPAAAQQEVKPVPASTAARIRAGASSGLPSMRSRERCKSPTKEKVNHSWARNCTWFTDSTTRSPFRSSTRLSKSM